MRVVVIGLGYVGLVTAAVLAHAGHSVIGVDIDRERVAELSAGRLPFSEPDLPELVAEGRAGGRLGFTASYSRALEGAEVALIAVGTPPRPDGFADLTALRAVARELARWARPETVLAVKSTVPAGTGDWLESYLRRVRRGGPGSFRVVSNPEFLRQGRAVADALHPDRVVIGTEDAAAGEVLHELYWGSTEEILHVGRRTAELIKYAANAFLATKISFINEMAALCEALNADVTEVAHGIGLDPRIGPAFLQAGIGFGGSCLPKDLKAVQALGGRYGVRPRLLAAVEEVNEKQRLLLAERLLAFYGDVSGLTLAFWGLSFKGGTGDLRDAPALELAAWLADRGARVQAFDPSPEARAVAARVLPAAAVQDDPYGACRGAAGLLVLTDWPEFGAYDLERVARELAEPLVLDGRNVLAPARARSAGLVYWGVGRGRPPALPDRTALRRRA